MELNHRCFSFQFYIKPQLSFILCRVPRVVSHSNSTSNHNTGESGCFGRLVVSHSNSTSNHNSLSSSVAFQGLFLIPILHQTTTLENPDVLEDWLFLIPILHQTTTIPIFFTAMVLLFLIPILHQTTTARGADSMLTRCFSFQFYIKPQRRGFRVATSRRCFSFQFYIKPQHQTGDGRCGSRCFSFQFYIKPQLSPMQHSRRSVVSHSNSTSNHNENSRKKKSSALFLIPILHQTTTCR